MRKTYGGTLMGTQFVKNTSTSIDELSEADRQAIAADIEKQRQAKVAELQRRQKKHEARRKKEQMQETMKMRAQQDQAGTDEQKRRMKNVEELKSWLQRKEEESRIRREQEAEAMQSIVEKARSKEEALRIMEERRQEDRRRRLAVAERRKAQLTNMLAAGSSPSSSQELKPAPRQRPQEASHGGSSVLHRHVHHHVHYHRSKDGELDAGDSQGSWLQMSPEEQRALERSSEQQALQELQPMRRSASDVHVHHHHGKDDRGTAVTPSRSSRGLGMAGSMSVGSLGPGQMTPPGLGSGYRQGGGNYPGYQRGLDMAANSYAVGGRPWHAQPAGAVPAAPFGSGS